MRAGQAARIPPLESLTRQSLSRLDHQGVARICLVALSFDARHADRLTRRLIRHLGQIGVLLVALDKDRHPPKPLSSLPADVADSLIAAVAVIAPGGERFPATEENPCPSSPGSSLV